MRLEKGYSFAWLLPWDTTIALGMRMKREWGMRFIMKMSRLYRPSTLERQLSQVVGILGNGTLKKSPTF